MVSTEQAEAAAVRLTQAKSNAMSVAIAYCVGSRTFDQMQAAIQEVVDAAEAKARLGMKA